MIKEHWDWYAFMSIIRFLVVLLILVVFIKISNTCWRILDSHMEIEKHTTFFYNIFSGYNIDDVLIIK